METQILAKITLQSRFHQNRYDYWYLLCKICLKLNLINDVKCETSDIRQLKAESDIWQIIYNFCQILNLLSRRITLLRWWVTTISINMVPIPQNYNTNLCRKELIWKLANHFDYSPHIVFNRTYGRIERHNPPINGSSIDNIAEGVLCKGCAAK